MPENYPIELLLPQIRRAPDHKRLKIIVAISLFALLAAGSTMVMIIWWGATN